MSGQQRGDLMELAIGERPLELPDHDCIEASVIQVLHDGDHPSLLVLPVTP